MPPSDAYTFPYFLHRRRCNTTIRSSVDMVDIDYQLEGGYLDECSHRDLVLIYVVFDQFLLVILEAAYRITKSSPPSICHHGTPGYHRSGSSVLQMIPRLSSGYVRLACESCAIAKE